MKVLKGMPAASAMLDKLKDDICRFSKRNIIPTLAIIRIGENPDDLSYERGISKRFEAASARVIIKSLPVNCAQSEVENTLTELNGDRDIHGIMIFRPLPKRIEEERLKNFIAPEKDVDCFGNTANAKLFACESGSYPPCTPAAVLELLDFYGIDLCGKRVTIVGRSLVVGKPLAIMLLARNATVTICHTKTENLAQECRRADVLIAAAGCAEMITTAFVNEKQIVIDVGINIAGERLCGDVDYAVVSPAVAAITPVPGGVGSVTTAVLLKHTVECAVKTPQTEV